MKILVTGATGVIGRRLVPLLRTADHDITAVARSAAGRAQLKRHGATAIDVDLFDPAAVRRAVAGHDAVINLATHIPHHTFQIFLPYAWHENDRLRRVASATLVDACIAAGVRRFIQESFAPIYTDCGDQWIDENTPIKPVRYNRTVADAENSANRFSQSGGTGVVLRFGAFYGPDAFQTLEMIKWVKRGWSAIPGPTNAFVSSISHDDAAAATAVSIELPPGVYNVVDDDPVTHRVFFESMAEALSVDPPRHPPQWATLLFGSLGEMLARSLRISNRKLRSLSTWTPEYPSVRQGWPALIAQIGAERNLVRGARARQNKV